MKLDAVPELIQGIINENIITEEMLEEEKKLFENSKNLEKAVANVLDKDKNLEIARELLIKIDERWPGFYENLENSPIAQYDGDLQKLLLFIKALKWIKEESIKAIDEKKYDRLAALKLLTDDIGERINKIIVCLATVLENNIR